MTEIKQDEVQQELFGEFGSQASKQKPRFPSLHKTQKPILFSTSIEQVLLASILLILAGCLIFFLGILRGKSLGAGEKTAVVAVNAPVSQVRTATVQRRIAASPTVPVLPAKTPTAAAAAAKAREAVAKEPPRTDLGKPYTIQLVTFKKQEIAEREVGELRKKGLYAFIIPSGDYYQVCAGQYVSKEDAGRNLKAFAGRYKDCFIRRR